MSRHHAVAAGGERMAFTSPRYPGDNDEPDVQEIKCDVCNKVFTRSEHLRRHKRAHSAEKPFACVECKKRFARLDVLRRHRVGHELKRKESASDSMRRYSRACFACASARVKCLRGNVCQRCRSRDIRCEYPSRRKHSSQATSEEGSHRDEGMAEPDEVDSCVITCTVENRPNDEVFGSPPKESSWVSHLLVAMASNSDSNGQAWNDSSPEMSLPAPGAVQTPSSTESPMGTGEQLLPESFIMSNETIVAGAQLIPQVSERNIGSIYNYSGINWLYPTDPTHIDQTFGAHSVQSEDSPNTSVREFTNYVPEREGRISIQDRAKGQTHSPVSLFAGHGTSSLSPTMHDSLQNIDNQLVCEYTHEQLWISEESYMAVTEYLKRTSLRDIAHAHTESFPSLKELNGFAVLYFDKFHDSFPLLHKASFLNSKDGCLLELAIAAIGACYAGTIRARKCSELLHELIHTLLDIAATSGYNLSDFPGVFGFRAPGYLQPLSHTQARILNVLGMFHSGNPKLVGLAREDRATLVASCMDSKFLVSNHYHGWQAARSSEDEGDRFLQQWLVGELECRAGYFVWMLDCMMAYESDHRTHLDLFDGKAPLPCPEQIWDEPMLNKAQILILNSGPPSLCLALDILYTEKRLVPNLGELSRILLIHGMYRRVWEVARYHNDSLSDWVPTPLSEPHHRITLEKTTRQSPQSAVSSWTNGSCDCLDVLHWSAQCTILQASALEHPTVLHLHLARLILLAPVSDLQKLAKAKLHQNSRGRSETYLYSSMQEHALRGSLLKWVAQDQYKARLAIIHAGSVFWHLRRYSCGAVIEPFAIYIASLVLWTYSVSTSTAALLIHSPESTVGYGSRGGDSVEARRNSGASQHSQDCHTKPGPAVLEDDGNMSSYYEPSPLHRRIGSALEQLERHETSLIQLDRPCDDELVQLFVRFGEHMTPYMARIGDIKGIDSSEKILREGIRLLSSQGNKPRGFGTRENEGRLNFTWGIAEEFSSLLSALRSI